EERLRAHASQEWEAALKAIKTPEEKRSKEQKELAGKYKDIVTISDDDIRNRFPEFAAFQDQAQKAQAAREKERPKPLDAISSFFETDPNPPAHHVLLRGQHNSPGNEVQPGVPVAFCTTTNNYHVSPLVPPGRVVDQLSLLAPLGGVGGEGKTISSG